MRRVRDASHLRSDRPRSTVLLVSLFLTACSLVVSPTEENASPADDGGAPSTQTADVTFTVSAVAETPVDAQIALVVVDEVSGSPYNTQEIPMQQLTDGRWQAIVTRPLKSMLHYKYALRGSTNADEVTSRGDGIRYRTLWMTTTTAVDDQIGAWAGGSYAGPTGRIVGTVLDADSSQPLPDVFVNASGVSAWTDGQGGFRLDGLLPGLHTLTAISADGSRVPFQQGAVVAADSATPVRLALQPATPVQVTFEVEIPADTAAGMSLRMAGNLRQFGDRFADLPGGTGGAIGGMPTLVQVDANHYILITELFSGTDFRYKYTLGDGLWNAERDLQGFLKTRQLTVPDTDLVVQDVVESWATPGQGAVTFNVQVVVRTLADAPIGLQLMPSDGFQPLPMGQTAQDSWSYVVYGPLDSGEELQYRYCRMSDCSRVHPGGTGESLPGDRTLDLSADPLVLDDAVASWVWQTEPAFMGDLFTPDIEARPGFEAGVELQPDPDPNSIQLVKRALGEIADGGANAVTLTPGWELGRPNQSPMMAFDPSDAPFVSEIEAEMAAARKLGLEVSLRPTLSAGNVSIAEWWQASARDTPWWNAWFETYRSFLWTYAQVAADGGADKIILGGPEVAPAFPQGILQDGSLAGAPPDADDRWRDMIDGVRSIFPGTIALDLELGESLQPPPAFVDAVDQVYIYWHPALDPQGGGSIDDLRAEAGRRLDEDLLGDSRIAGKPIILSVEYPSVDGGAGGCIQDPGGGCYPVSDFAMGGVPDPALSLDLKSQASAYAAVMMEAFGRTQISGIYTRGYNPSIPLLDLSASVRGKPAQDVLWYWFSRITGKIAP